MASGGQRAPWARTARFTIGYVVVLVDVLGLKIEEALAGD